MTCINCGREIEDLSVYCNWCGHKQIRERHKRKALSVPEPRRLPSGKWNIQLRREGESITESTAERCRRAALEVRRQWEAEERLGLHQPPIDVVTLGSVIDTYLSDNSNILSPSTLRSYKSYRDHRFQCCMGWNIFDASNPWQAAINEELVDVSAKTVSNAWRLCTVAMRRAGATVPEVNLKRVVRQDHQFLRFDQIEKFLDAIKGEDCELACLLALHSLRFSELIALRPSDVSLKKKTLLIRGARVLNSDDEYEYVSLNKTDKSRREVPIVIPRLLKLLKDSNQEQEYVADWTQKRLYDQVNRICRANGLPRIGVHGLRHSFASLAYHLGWKEKSTMQVGGWVNSDVVREIYTHNADLESDIETMRDFYKT